MANVVADMTIPGPAGGTPGEFAARLAGLQGVADAASPTGAGTIPMRQVFDLAGFLPLFAVDATRDAAIARVAGA